MRGREEYRGGSDLGANRERGNLKSTDDFDMSEATQQAAAATEAAESWYAIQVRPRYERLVDELLSEKSVETFLPLHEKRRRWSDRLKRLQCPLIPGYVFARFRLLEKHVVVTTSGIVRIIGAGNTPLPVSEKEIAALQQVVRHGVPVQPHEYLSVGDSVCLQRGPLCGVSGILIRKCGDYRLVVSVNLLRRSVAVEVDSDWIAAPAPATSGGSLTRMSAPVVGY